MGRGREKKTVAHDDGGAAALADVGSPSRMIPFGELRRRVGAQAVPAPVAAPADHALVGMERSLPAKRTDERGENR
jgi:hypothetical protein